jgi:hypothetical protein
MPAAVVGVVSGLLVARAERPSPASTEPSRGTPPHAAVAGSRAPARFELGSGVVLETSPLGVTWHGRQASITIEPSLEFERTSPDGFWSIFAGQKQPAPAVVSATSAAGALELWAVDGTRLLQAERNGALLSLDAWTVLDRPVYSHLNSFTTVRIDGHRRLGLRFSPCSDVTVEVTHADYPAGAPARFAYVDASRWFHVVQATDAEKGPFSPIAKGLLRPGEPLAIDLVELDGGARPFARIEFADFAAELSTALSPTAGYGVSENAVEFGLAAPDARSPAHLVLTLAASGVGRGWDSVGHRAGAYRNRVSLRSLEPAPDPSPQLDDATIRQCQDLARAIAALRPRFPELAAFDPARVRLHPGECSLDYDYRTHPSTRSGGWRAQVPEPDSEGIWFHLGIWDPNSDARREQINSQPGLSVFALGDRNITVLILHGAKQERLADALWQLLRRRGVKEPLR